MKVELERRLGPCPDRLKCFACGHEFFVSNIRALLSTDAGLIYGDVCPTCLKSKQQGIQQKMREQSRQLLEQANQDAERSLPLRRQALELLSLSQETCKLPNLYQRLRKRLEIFAQETQELEAARLGLNRSCTCGKQARLRIVFDEPDN